MESSLWDSWLVVKYRGMRSVCCGGKGFKFFIERRVVIEEVVWVFCWIDVFLWFVGGLSKSV